MGEVRRFVGIDIAKVALDVFSGPTGEAFALANAEVGISQLLRQMEAGGVCDPGSDRWLRNASRQCLGGCKIAAVIVNARQVSDIVCTTGRLGKTPRSSDLAWPRPGSSRPVYGDGGGRSKQSCR
jgi:hypothetical protein